MSDKVQTFPIRRTRKEQHRAAEVYWPIAEVAYRAYVQKYGTSQSIHGIAGRGGFGASEMDLFFPGWEKENARLDKCPPVDVPRVLWAPEYRTTGLSGKKVSWRAYSRKHSILAEVLCEAPFRFLVECSVLDACVASGFGASYEHALQVSEAVAKSWLRRER